MKTHRQDDGSELLAVAVGVAGQVQLSHVDWFKDILRLGQKRLIERGRQMSDLLGSREPIRVIDTEGGVAGRTVLILRENLLHSLALN